MQIRLEPWSEDDLELLRRINAPELRLHVGGPETEEKVVARHHRYVALGGTGTGRMFRIVSPEGEPAGGIGYWDRVWRDETVYETGWTVLTAFQGRGIATAAAQAAIASARSERKHRFMHAFPSVGNPASNGVCRKAGFTLLGETEFEFPPGHLMRSNDWRADLSAPSF